MRLENKVALVTGASKGIGLAAAVALAREGARVALLSRDAEAGEAAAAKCTAQGPDAFWVKTDVADASQVADAVRQTADRWGRIDILVNNAGIYMQGDVVSTAQEEWERVLSVNVTGAFLCAHYAVPIMLESGGGSVINVSSEAGLVGMANQTAYNVSKAALIALTRSMAVDFAAHNLRVNCVCPGTTFTPLVEEAVNRHPDPEAVIREWASRRPLNRLGKPEEIAAAIVFLASEESGYATGSVFAMDGGYTAM